MFEKLQEMIWRFVQKRKPRVATYHSYKTAHRILLLFESDRLERNIQIKTLIKELQADGKEVTAWGFVQEKKMAESAVLRDYRVLARQDFNKFFYPQDNEVQDLQREHFDLLIDLNVKNLLPLRYLNLLTNVDFRAGRQTEMPYLNDFMLAVGDDTDPAYLFDQLIHYLKNVESK